MDIEQLPLSLELLANSGITLNHEKYNLLMHSLIVLQNENHFKKVYLWGQIYGTQEDYYIAFGYKKDALRGRVFYYSCNGFTWVLLPNLHPRDKAHYLSCICTTRFFGKPSIKIDILDEAPSEEKPLLFSEDIDEEISETKNLTGVASENKGESTNTTAKRYAIEDIRDHYKLKEEDRLMATVRFINQEAAIAPRGALFKQTNGHVVPNPAFQGLQTDEAMVLTNYMHYRIPKERWEINVGRRPDYNYATDFLDTIAEDIPRNGVWSAHIVQGSRAVILSNLYWPGYTFYHLLNSKIHGYLYLGYGRRNIDLPFMI